MRVLKHVPSICPFCHEDVDPASSDWVACRGCLARHHVACWGEAGECAACRARHFLPATTARDDRLDWRSRPAIFGAALGMFMGALPVFIASALIFVGGLSAVWRGSTGRTASSVGMALATLLGLAACARAGAWVGQRLARR